MKKKYAVDQIRPGTTFTADVYSDGTNLFVPADNPVLAKDLEGLKQWGVLFVYSDGDMVSATEKPAGTADDKTVKKGLATIQDRKLFTVYTDLISRLRALMDQIAAGESIEPRIVDKLAQDVLQL